MVWKIPSIKMGRMVLAESQLERSYFIKLEYDWNVISFQEQPLKIPYEVGGKVRFYTPDILVEFDDGTRAIVEIKPESQINNEENQRLFYHAKLYCYEKGLKYLIFTEKEIYAGNRLENIEVITNHRNHPHRIAVASDILGFLAQIGHPIRFHSIANVLPQPPVLLWNTIMSMAYWLEIYIDLDADNFPNDALIAYPPRIYSKRTSKVFQSS